MRAISLWQPWASLFLSPHKLHETRHWPTNHRGRLAIHAAKRFEKDHAYELADLLRQEFGARWFATLPTGALIGVVDLVDCQTTEAICENIDAWAPSARAAHNDFLCGNFDEGRYGWRRAPTVNVFKTPIPYLGRQGFFSVPDELVLEALAA